MAVRSSEESALETDLTDPDHPRFTTDLHHWDGLPPSRQPKPTHHCDHTVRASRASFRSDLVSDIGVAR